MHIKEIRLSNFRSFRDQTGDVTFSAGMNSLVGRNGSGKSNLFDAVQFVLLAPRFANLRQEERQALLHEGSGSAAVNAYVEVVFDNSDHRLQLEHADEVVLRRTIGLQKDEIFLQRRRTTKAEIQSLLEGAGFSKSNPYFLVRQGKVQDLCTMTDKDRLKLLQGVAGTVVYDEKKEESSKKMMENSAKREKIAGLLEDMDERLDELSAERDELTAYTSLDRNRRAVEYSLYQAEVTKARSLLATIEEERAQHATRTTVHADARQTHLAIQDAHAAAQRWSGQLRRHQSRVAEAHEDMRQAAALYGQFAAEYSERKQQYTQGEELYKQNQKELKRVLKEIAQSEENMSSTVQPAYDEAQKKLRSLQDAREKAARDLQAIYAKQGRTQQFDTQEERDKFLQTQLEELQRAAAEKEEEVASQRDQLAALRRTVEQHEEKLEKANATVQETVTHRQSFRKNMDDKKVQRLELQDQRKESWRQLESKREVVRQAREDCHKAFSNRNKTMPRATRMGLQALKSIVEQERGIVEGRNYFGVLMDNFTLNNPKYQTAVEMAAQNSLFHVVVDTDETATTLLKRLEKGRLGRVTFLPLNQLRVEDVDYPDNPDVRPLLDLCVKYDKKVERAMKHVFAKKLVCRSPEVAAEWSVKLGMDALTLDGDLCSRKGAMTGGFVDSNASRLGAHQHLQKVQKALQVSETEFEGDNQKAQEMDRSTTKLIQELQSLEAKHSQLGSLLERKETELEKLRAERKDHQSQLQTLETTSLPALERVLAALNGDILRVQNEIGTEMTDVLSDLERGRVQELKENQNQLATQIEEQSEALAEASIERQKLLSLLNDNLFQRRKELSETAGEDKDRRKSRLSSTALQQQRKEELEDSKTRLDMQTRHKEAAEAHLESARAEEEHSRQEMLAAKNELEQLQSQDNKNMKAMAEFNEKTERLLNKRSMCISKRETYARKIQELGSLPPPAEIDKVSGKSISELMKILESINKKLKKYSHVNKKAFDQYVNFSEQREALLKRKDELDRGAEKVKELIESLDQKKDEAINRTFRGVRSHFKDVFNELVPNGAGELVMRTAVEDIAAADDDGDTDNEDSSVESPRKGKKLDANNPDVSLYRGIGIKVRFSEVGENYIMSQLSGGQKALVALSLIFAIQRCDPAPFYLFDELDQALDSSYRAAVADLIKRQASNEDSPTQFIVSTFRPELVAASSRWFGISHQNKASRLHGLKRKDSLHFIANLMNEEEAVGEVTTVATSRKSVLSKESRKRKQTEIVEAESSDHDEETDVADEESA